MDVTWISDYSVESKCPNHISTIPIWCLSGYDLDAPKQQCRKPTKIIEAYKKQKEDRNVLMPALSRAWVEFLDERALERPEIRKTLQALSGEQIFAHIQLQVTKSGCLFSFLLIIPHF